MMKAGNQNLSLKQNQLKQKKVRNQKYISQIKELKQEIKSLNWRIPEKGVHDGIQQLKQSIKIPTFMTNQPQKSIEQLLEEHQSKVSKQSDSKMIKYLESKRQMLQKLDKLKVQGNLYHSHKRVILKQYLQELREKLKIQRQANQALELQKCNLQEIKKQYQTAQNQVNKTSQQLSASSTLNQKFFTRNRSFM